MISIPDNEYCEIANADWLNNLTAFSVALWIRYPTVTTARKQYAFSHRSSNQFSLRKDSTSDKFRSSVTVSTFVTCDSTFVVIANTLYHVGFSWVAGDAAGLKLYINGALDNSSSTTGQSGPYDSGASSTSLLFGARTTTSDFGLPHVEGFVHFPRVLTADEFRRLYEYGRHHLAVPDTRPRVAYSFDGSYLAKLFDTSGNGRHITTIAAGAADQRMRGRWSAPGSNEMSGGIATVAGAPAPNPWTEYGTRAGKAATQLTLAGLTPGAEYQFRLRAVDVAGQESPDSAIVATFAGVADVIHTPREVFLG